MWWSRMWMFGNTDWSIWDCAGLMMRIWRWICWLKSNTNIVPICSLCLRIRCGSYQTGDGLTECNRWRWSCSFKSGHHPDWAVFIGNGRFMQSTESSLKMEFRWSRTWRHSLCTVNVPDCSVSTRRIWCRQYTGCLMVRYSIPFVVCNTMEILKGSSRRWWADWRRWKMIINPVNL